MYLMQMFYYLLFINVDYPKNIEAFLRIFKFSTLDFLPNPFSSSKSKSNTTETIVDKSEWLPSPPKFYDNDYSGNLF